MINIAKGFLLYHVLHVYPIGTWHIGLYIKNVWWIDLICKYFLQTIELVAIIEFYNLKDN